MPQSEQLQLTKYVIIWAEIKKQNESGRNPLIVILADHHPEIDFNLIFEVKQIEHSHYS